MRSLLRPQKRNRVPSSERIHAELKLYQFGEAVDPEAEVGIPAFNVDFLKLVRVTKHAPLPHEREKGFHPMHHCLPRSPDHRGSPGAILPS